MRGEQFLPGDQSLMMGVITAPDTGISITFSLKKKNENHLAC